MSKKKLFACVLCVVLSISVLFPNTAFCAALLTFETQYNYNSANNAWLTDLVIKEDMNTVAGLASRVELQAQPVYPYTKTPESFSEDVANYCSLYDLNEGSPRAGYVYLFDLINQNTGILAADVSDATVKDYLEGVGIVYPESVGKDESVIARALYSAMVSGAFGTANIGTGTALDEALVTFVASMSGLDRSTLNSWTPDGSMLSLDEYIAAASRLALWSSGYNVTADTDTDEVFKLVAVMTLENLGISVDSNLSFDELKIKYMAAMLGKKYSVQVEDAVLAEALKNDTVDFYMLQLIGNGAGLAIRSDSYTYSEAFYLVAENAGTFDIEPGEFYADISDYNAYLSYKRNTLWVYPTAYATDNTNGLVSVTVNGIEVKNNYYNKISVDANAKQSVLKIVVSFTSRGEIETSTYNITIYQGDDEYVSPNENTTQNNQQSFADSDSVVRGILSSMGLNYSVISMMDSFYYTLPGEFKNIMSFIAPTFGDSDSISVPSPVNSEDDALNNLQYTAILDKIGSVVDTSISGINGITLNIASSVEGIELNLVSFD